MDTSKEIYIVSDVHGRYEALQEALYDAKLLDDYGNKKDGAFIVQLGDIANCVKSSVEGDLKCLSMVGNEIDLMLIGNHEIPYFDATNAFSGFFSNYEISSRLYQLRAWGCLKPAYCDPLFRVIVTHAGISQSQLNFGTGTDAFNVWHKLDREWNANNYTHHLFRDIGKARNGSAAIGGILWCDFDREFEPTEFPQIVGHTPGILRQKNNALCIDTQSTNADKPTVLKLS